MMKHGECFPQELRLEDYVANRKGPQQQQAGLGFLGSTSQTTQASSAFGVFGQPTKPAFSGKASFLLFHLCKYCSEFNELPVFCFL